MLPLLALNVGCEGKSCLLNNRSRMRLRHFYLELGSKIGFYLKKAFLDGRVKLKHFGESQALFEIFTE